MSSDFLLQHSHTFLKPGALCRSLLLQEILQMTTSCVVEFSCCVPRYRERGQTLTLYIDLFVIMLPKYRHTVAAYISNKRD